MTKKLYPQAVADRELGMVISIADIGATPQQIYNALITDEVETWWGAPGVYTVQDWKGDLRIGGKWTLNVVRPDGVELPASGEFLELNEPRKIVITRRYDWDFPELGRRDTKVVYLIDAMEDVTRLTIRQEGFGDAIWALYEHAEGWERCLGWLKNYLER